MAAPFFIDEKIVIIKDVPAEVCADHGEAFTKSSVAGQIEDISDKPKRCKKALNLRYVLSDRG